MVNKTAKLRTAIGLALVKGATRGTWLELEDLPGRETFQLPEANSEWDELRHTLLEEDLNGISLCSV